MNFGSPKAHLGCEIYIPYLFDSGKNIKTEEIKTWFWFEKGVDKKVKDNFFSQIDSLKEYEAAAQEITKE
ncbi:MAG: hypothetical protein HQK88_15500 [Nitrospirae bacterium]|nr:hypothetical protein [Nitrospirota bacterium]MBF0536169.1 hypothetical protein [Nitrospirota bacterium]MBF0618206.1 hypothetical protein [Nitrospirota bacterium]